MLADRDSTSFHLNTARRHQRLARRYREESFAVSLEASIKALAEAESKTEAKRLDAQGAYDAVFAADADLDDAIRDLFGAAETHDRAHPEAPALMILFPDGGFGEIVEQPLAQEPNSADALATRVEGLGAAGLALFAAKIRTAAQAVRDALAEQDTAVRAAKSADADEELAQAALRRAYEGNYLDLRKKLGRVFSERLFPRVRASGGAATEAASRLPKAG
jgi:hypothetical protein